MFRAVDRPLPDGREPDLILKNRDGRDEIGRYFPATLAATYSAAWPSPSRAAAVTAWQRVRADESGLGKSEVRRQRYTVGIDLPGPQSLGQQRGPAAAG